MQYDSLSEFYDIFNDNFHYTSYLDKVFSKFDLPNPGLHWIAVVEQAVCWQSYINVVMIVLV